jgi:hypothetical protein
MESGCVEWTGRTDAKGYARIWLRGRGREIYAHRLAYLLAHGELHQDLDLCVQHSCPSAACINPDHLFLNTRRGTGIGTPRDQFCCA